jgi:hypothetical protein
MPSFVYRVVDASADWEALDYCEKHPVLVDQDEDNYITYNVELHPDVKATRGEAISFGKEKAQLLGPSLLIGFQEADQTRWLMISQVDKVVSY